MLQLNTVIIPISEYRKLVVGKHDQEKQD